MVIWSENMFTKGNWCCSYHSHRNFANEKLLGGENLNIWHLTLKRSTLDFAHISNRLLHKIVPVCFLTMSYLFFITITPRVLKSNFAWKQLKVDYSKNILKEENREHGFSSVGWLHTSEKKLLKTAILRWCTSSWNRKSS